MIAHEYHWAESFIIRELPLVRLANYQQAILERKGGKPAGGKITTGEFAFMQALEEELRGS